ncbi:beta-glucosidase BglX [uncultured Winogradskyella sp.]|uniref:beta-glucosidase BglX n=1 Tax=uncultured Winogradskyella sp. TaxID=395353 RepID=UPI002606AE2C|nr:beta-glucosidase BglX [uncultured Winogradskyella sp.]
MKYQLKHSVLLVTVFILAIISCSTKKHTLSIVPDDIVDKKIDSLLAIMTIEEKVGQMNLYNGFWDVTGPVPKGSSSNLKYEHLKKGYVGAMLNIRGVEHVRELQRIAVEESRLGIPLLFGFDVIHGLKTLSPIPLAESASWDLQAIENSARVAAIEASAAGINWTFAPMVDISRDPRWGRVMEGAGEDTYLGSKIAKARVKGFQGNDLSKNNTIAACAKHFAAYGFSESGKEYNTVSIDNVTLLNTVLPPFKAAVDSDVKTVMNSFNTLNGIPVTASKYLQRTILKDGWNFEGFVVSDWASINELIFWGHAKDKKEAAKLASVAGSDMDMEGYVYIRELANLVNEGIVEESLINDAARRILKVKFELGLFEDPYRYCNEENQKEMIGSESNNEAVLDMAKKSIVLLKNEKNLLPLNKAGQKIALIGELASDKNSPLGSWRLASDDNTAVSVLEGMKVYKDNSITYTKGVDVFLGKTSFISELKINNTDNSGIKEAVDLAKTSDVVVMVLGEHGFQSGEARSRTSIDLPGLQQKLLEAVYEVNKNIVLVLQNGRPLTIEWASENIPAIVEGWQLGTQSGHAIAQVLYGDYNPSGKLPMTFPRNVGQIPIYYNHKSTGRPNNSQNNVFWSHYSDKENTPLYQFGHGLSYTDFKYKNLSIEQNGTSSNKKVKVSVDITNTGKYDGKEVVQLYIRDLVASITRPVKELKGFELIELQKGETKTITFELTDNELGFFNNKGDFIVEKGDFQVFVGGSSITSLQDQFTL